MSSSYQKKRKLAKEYFVFNMMNAKDIADLLSITEKTAGKWRKDDDWDKERDEVLANPNEIRRILLAEMKRIASGEKPRIDSDALSKVSKGIQAVSDKLSPQVVVAVIQWLDNFLAENNPQLAVDSLPAHRDFIRHVISLND